MEVFDDAEAMAAFDLSGIGKSPARFDFKKLENLSGEHMRRTPDDALLAELGAFLAVTGQPPVPGDLRDRLLAALPFAKAKAKTLPQLLEQAGFALARRPLDLAPEAAKALDSVSHGILADLTPQLHNARWERGILEGIVSAEAERQGTTLGKLAGPLRAALSGRTVAPSVFDMMVVLGRDETIGRLHDVLGRES
jgi:glutamyl-tRNA synthetase